MNTGGWMIDLQIVDIIGQQYGSINNENITKSTKNVH